MRLVNSYPFKFVKNYDVNHISKRILELDEDIWTSNTFNNQFKFSKEILEHIDQLKKQVSISRIWIKCTEDHWIPNRLKSELKQYGIVPYTVTSDNFHEYVKKFKINNVDSLLNEYTNIIVEELEHIYNGTAAGVVYSRIPAGKGVDAHIDKGYHPENSHRLHIPIITNNEVMFTIEDKSINMTVGSCYEVDNLLTHSVKNLGVTDRIHLIIDIVPKDKYSL